MEGAAFAFWKRRLGREGKDELREGVDERLTERDERTAKGSKVQHLIPLETERCLVKGQILHDGEFDPGSG